MGQRRFQKENYTNLCLTSLDPDHLYKVYNILLRTSNEVVQIILSRLKINGPTSGAIFYIERLRIIFKTTIFFSTASPNLMKLYRKGL